MPITRTTLLSGPASATFNGHTFFAHDGILITPALELDAVDSSSEGALDDTVSSGPVTIKFTPSATLADLLALWPYTMGKPGTPLFGPIDQPLVLVAANGIRLTFAAVAITQMPDLDLGSRGAVAGAVTFLALGARSLGLTDPNRVVAFDTATEPIPASGSPQLTDDYVVTWGGAPWVNLRSRDGIRLRSTMKTRPVLSDANALLDLTLERLEVTAAFTPATPNGPAEADLISALELQGTNSLPSRPLSAQAQALSIVGQGFSVEFPAATPTRGELLFDATRGRLGELIFKAERVLLTTGAQTLVAFSDGE